MDKPIIFDSYTDITVKRIQKQQRKKPIKYKKSGEY